MNKYKKYKRQTNGINRTIRILQDYLPPKTVKTNNTNKKINLR